MSEANTNKVPPGLRGRAILLGLCLGIGPPLGRELADWLRPSWGDWPARLTGVAAGITIGVAIFGCVILIDRRVNPERYQH